MASSAAINEPLCTGPFLGPAAGRLLPAGLPAAAGRLPRAAGKLPASAGSLFLELVHFQFQTWY